VRVCHNDGLVGSRELLSHTSKFIINNESFYFVKSSIEINYIMHRQRRKQTAEVYELELSLLRADCPNLAAYSTQHY
jgi:hypothetical protein